MTTFKRKTFNLAGVFELLICMFYTWYFLPVCNALLWTGFYKLLFFSCFAVGTIGMLLLNNFRINRLLVAVVGYLVVFAILYLWDVGDSDAHIRVSFTFWGTALLYFGALKDDSRMRIGKYLLVLLVITVLTSSIGVIVDNRAARTISHAGADDALQAAYKMKNISSVYLFQCATFFVPVLICIPKTFKTKFMSFLVLAFMLVVLVNASFTISLLVFVVAIFLSLLLKETKTKRTIAILIFAVITLVVALNGYDLLTKVGEIMGSNQISVRIYELRDLLYFGKRTGDTGLRWKLYMASAETFLENIFGVGVHYSYFNFENGIGYHSQILDDLARYGVAALVFYAVFLSGYYKHLKSVWKDVGYPQIATVTTIIYFVFLVLNLGFRSADESTVTLFIVPVLPLLIKAYYSKKKSNSFEG